VNWFEARDSVTIVIEKTRAATLSMAVATEVRMARAPSALMPKTGEKREVSHSSTAGSSTVRATASATAAATTQAGMNQSATMAECQILANEEIIRDSPCAGSGSPPRPSQLAASLQSSATAPRAHSFPPVVTPLDLSSPGATRQTVGHATRVCGDMGCVPARAA
jgi:hypothetical protein